MCTHVEEAVVYKCTLNTAYTFGILLSFAILFICRRAGCKFALHLADLEAKNLLEVCRLADEEQVEGPASAEVGHDNGVHWHGGEEMAPRGFEFLQ